MNGDTKLKLRGGLIGAVLTLFLTLASLAYGYGQVNSRLQEVENKADCIQEVRERLVSIESDVKWIKRNSNFQKMSTTLSTL